MDALQGNPVDRVPISFWGHNYVAENSADALAQETLRQARIFDWDYLKPQSRAQAFADRPPLRSVPAAPETEAIDLLDYAGQSVVKRVAPVLIVIAAVIGLVAIIRALRK